MGTPPKILLAEDEAIIALDIECDLEDMGVDVVGPCMSVTECIQTVETAEVDGAILDIDLRGKEVFPVASRLSAKNIPIVFHSGRNNRREIMKRFPKAQFFVKPERPETMLKALLAMGQPA